MKSQLVLALVLISIGVVGLIAVGCQSQTIAPFSNPQTPLTNPQGFGPQGFGFPNGMTPALACGASVGSGMMGSGMMGYGFGNAPPVNATPVPSTQAIDREIKIIARNSQFDSARITVKKGETVKFVITNQDAYAHNFVSPDGKIAYTFLPANATQSVVWSATEKGTFTVVCTYHPGMQMQIVVE